MTRNKMRPWFDKPPPAFTPAYEPTTEDLRRMNKKHLGLLEVSGAIFEDDPASLRRAASWKHLPPETSVSA